MTKLNEWLLGLTVFFGIYTALVTKSIKHDLIDEYMFYIQILPIVLVVLLGVSSDDLKMSLNKLIDSSHLSDLCSNNGTLQNANV